MRKIAARMGVTATNIYNYYTNKDEINLMIRIRGFEILHSMLKKAYDENHSPADRMRAMILAYADFGVSYPDYYDIMFNLRTPKVTDYMGTKFEPVATSLKTVAEKEFLSLCRSHFCHNGCGEGPGGRDPLHHHPVVVRHARHHQPLQQQTSFPNERKQP